MPNNLRYKVRGVISPNNYAVPMRVWKQYSKSSRRAEGTVVFFRDYWYGSLHGIKESWDCWVFAPDPLAAKEKATELVHVAYRGEKNDTRRDRRGQTVDARGFAGGD